MKKSIWEKCIFAPLEIVTKSKIMSEGKRLILVYLAIITVVTFFAYGIDKWKAQHKRWRIPESVLLGLAAIGGSVGAWLGMQVWHHKTQHKKFKYGVPAILAVQVALAVWWLLK